MLSGKTMPMENFNSTTNVATSIKLVQNACLKAKTKAQVELLERILLDAKIKRGKALNERPWITRDRKVQLEDADYAIYPYPKLDKFILADLFKLLEKEKISDLKQPLEKLNSLLWDKIKIYDSASLDTQEPILLLKAIVKVLKSKAFSDNPKTIKILKDINYWMKDWKTVNQLGLTDLPSLIKALKELIPINSTYITKPNKENPMSITTNYFDQITSLLDGHDSKYPATPKTSKPTTVKMELSDFEKELLSEVRTIRYVNYRNNLPEDVSEQINFLLDWHYSGKGLITESEFIEIDKRLSELEEQIFSEINSIKTNPQINSSNDDLEKSNDDLAISEEQIQFCLKKLIEKETELPPIYQSLEM